MKRYRVFLVFLFLLAGCVSGRSVLSPGEPAPDFNLKSLSGGEVTLADFKNKVVLLNFWASWCMPCASEMPAMQRLYDRLKGEGFVIVAVGVDDDIDSLKQFAQQYNLTFPVLIDDTGEIKRKYGVQGVPESFFIGRDGRMIMVPDLMDNRPVLKIVGPREWDSPTSEGRTRVLLKKGRP